MSSSPDVIRDQSDWVPDWIPFRHVAVGTILAVAIVWCVTKNPAGVPIIPTSMWGDGLPQFPLVAVFMPVAVLLGFRSVYSPLSHRLKLARRGREAIFRIILMFVCGAIAIELIVVLSYDIEMFFRDSGDPNRRSDSVSVPDRMWPLPPTETFSILLGGGVTAIIVEIISALQLAHVRIERTTQASIRRQTEAALAHRVQQRLLPERLPKMAGIDLAAQCWPAFDVGGDYYDVIQLSDDELAFVLADVSGMGTGAALLMSNIHAQIPTRIEMESDLTKLMTQVNAQLVRATEPGRFATLFLAVYNRRSKTLRYVNAGHDYPLLLQMDGGRAHLVQLPSTGPPIGVLPRSEYHEERQPIDPDSILMIYSDGLIDASSRMEQRFGGERLRRCLAQHGAGSAVDTLSAVMAAARNWSAGARQFDDMTAIAIRFGP